VNARTICARGLAKSYAGRAALTDLDLTVPAGTVHAVLGPNGAGKTTLLRILLGLTRPDSGTLEVLGTDRDEAAARATGGIAGFVDDPRFHPYLSARANLDQLAALDGLHRAEARDRVERGLTEVGLDARAGDRVGGFSLGMRQRLGLAAALLRRPGLLVLDEPANGLDPGAADQLWGTLRQLAAAGTTVLLSSHDLTAVDAVADEVTVLRSGVVAWTGPLAVLRTYAPMPEHLLRTADDRVARELAVHRGVAVHPGPAGELRVVADQADLDGLTIAFGRAGVGVRSLAPGTAPLRALFTALTEDDPPATGLPPPAPPAALRSTDDPPPASTDPAARSGTAPAGAALSRAAPSGAALSRAAPAEAAPSRAALFAAACRTESRRLLAQTRVRLLGLVCLLAPFAFAGIVDGTHTLPADTLYGRWLLESGAALPLVVLAFAASWAFPLLGSVVAGDILAAEDRLGTWPTLLTRSCGRGVLIGAKSLVAAVAAVLAVVLLAASSTVAGLLLAGRTPLIGLSGQLITPSAADRLVAIAWAGSLPTVLAWTAVALVLSAWTRSAIVGIAGPALLGVLGQLATLVDGPPALRQLLLSSTLEAWHGLAEIPADPRQLLTGVLVGAAWTLVVTAGLSIVVNRRSFGGGS
jgi:ABC-2 type transport system ATP-binding protein